MFNFDAILLDSNVNFFVDGPLNTRTHNDIWTSPKILNIWTYEDGIILLRKIKAGFMLLVHMKIFVFYGLLLDFNQIIEQNLNGTDQTRLLVKLLPFHFSMLEGDCPQVNSQKELFFFPKKFLKKLFRYGKKEL